MSKFGEKLLAFARALSIYEYMRYIAANVTSSTSLSLNWLHISSISWYCSRSCIY